MSTPRGKRVVMVAAVADNGVIGAGGDIPWRIPEDFAHFKRITLGHTLVMGRATYDSIGRPLPGPHHDRADPRPRRGRAEGVLVAGSLDEALALAADLPGESDVVIAGGAHVYAEAHRRADEQVLTEVHRSPEGDTFYPAFDRSEWVETAREARDGYDWVWLRRA